MLKARIMHVMVPTPTAANITAALFTYLTINPLQRPFLHCNVITLLNIVLLQSLNYLLSQFFSVFRVKFALVILRKRSRTKTARLIFKFPNHFR